MNMLRPSVNQLITKNESSYSLVIGVAKRAREIADELYGNWLPESTASWTTKNCRTKAEWKHRNCRTSGA